MRKKLLAAALGGSALLLLLTSPADAQTSAAEVLDASILADNMFVLICAIFVVFMQAGFAMLEVGFSRMKNAGAVMAKIFINLSIAAIAFWVVGWSLVYGGDNLGGWFGGFSQTFYDMDFVGGGGEFSTFIETEEYNLLPGVDFFFQFAFAAVSLAIVWGTMLDRTKFIGYVIFGGIFIALIYPTVAHWTWGGGWLAQLDTPFSDFAGSTIVHATGGWAALMGALILGPRIGKYSDDGTPRAIPGHSIPFVVMGAIILFIGWFGFNAGSELAADEFVMQIAVRTLLAGCAGAVVATATAWWTDGKPDVSMAANGLLAGLVAITAPVGAVTSPVAILIGAVGGALVVFSVRFFDRLRIDDPVGAISVHGVCGTWGTLSIGLFARFDDAFLGRENAGLLYGGGLSQMGTQLTMVVVHFIFVVVASGLLFLAISKTVGLRVTREEEMAGLDTEEHGSPGYGPDLVPATAGI